MNPSIAQYNANNPNDPIGMAAPTPGGGGHNGWASWLPTLGGIAAPILGALLAPETGGLSLLGTIGLSAAGSAAGKGAQQMAQGTGFDPGAVLGSGIAGAEGGAIGGIGGKLLGSLVGKVAGAADNSAATTAAAEYAAPFKGIAGSAAAKSNNLAGTMDFMKNLGVANDPAAWRAAAGAGTGSDGILSQELRGMLTDAGPVNLEPGQLGALHQADGLSSGTSGWLKDQLDGITSQETLNNGSAGGATIGEVADPNGLLDTIQGIDRKISQIVPNDPRVQVTPEALAEADALRGVKSTLQDTLYNHGGLNDAVAAYKVTPELEQEIMNRAGGNPQLAKYLVDSLNNSQTGQELRSAQAPLVRASKLAQAALYDSQGDIPGAAAAKSAQGAAADHASILGTLMAGHPLGAAGVLAGNLLRDSGGVVGKGAQLISRADAATPEALSIPGVLGNLVAQPTFHAGTDFAGPILADNTNSGGSAMQPIIPGAAGAGAAGNPNLMGDPSNMVTPALLNLAIKADLTGNGGKDLGTLVPALQSAMFGGMGHLSGEQTKQVADTQSAEQAIQELQGLYNAQGGGHGWLGGSIANVFGFANPALKAYGAASAADAAKIAAALGTTPQAAHAYLPQPTDTPETANSKMAALEQMLQSVGQNATQSGFSFPGFGVGGSGLAGGSSPILSGL